MMMGGLKGGEGELAADGGGAGPLAVSHSWKRKPLFSEPQCRKTILKPICRVGKTMFRANADTEKRISTQLIFRPTVQYFSLFIHSTWSLPQCRVHRVDTP